MTRLLQAAVLSAALAIGSPAFPAAQEPAPTEPVLLPGTRARVPVEAPDQPAPPARIVVDRPEKPVAAAPGEPVGRGKDATEAAEQRRGGNRRGGRDDSARPAPRGSGRDVGTRRGRFPAPTIRTARPVYVTRPYYYDPFWASGAFGWSPLFYTPWSLIWSTAGYGSYPWYGPTTFATGGVRLKMKPREAQVFADGFYAGVVDDFDGVFQSLRLAPGGHRIEVRLPGFETVALDIHIQPDRTIKIEETMRPVSP